MRYDEKSKSKYISYVLQDDNTYAIGGYKSSNEVIDKIEIPNKI